MKAFKYLISISPLLFIINANAAPQYKLSAPQPWWDSSKSFSSPSQACSSYSSAYTSNSPQDVYFEVASVTEQTCQLNQFINGSRVGFAEASISLGAEQKCEAGIVPLTLKVPVSSGKMVCVDSCQYSLTKCVDVDFEAGMTCDGVNEGRECGTPPPTTTPTTPPVTQDPTNPTDKTDEQKTFENIMHVIGEKLDGIKDAITGGNQNQNGGNTGGSNGGTTGGDVTVNVDMSETNSKIDETNSLIDELTKWFQGEDLGDDIFGDSEPPEKELTPQQLDTSIFSSRSQCPADARLSFNLLGGKSFTKTFEFTDWCDNLEIFGSLILIASYLFGAFIIVSKS